MKFPRLVFKNNGPYDREGGSYDHTLVYNEAEYEALTRHGWYFSLSEAIEPREAVITPEVTPEDAPPTREELEAKLLDLGIKYDKRLGNKKLENLINKALEG